MRKQSLKQISARAEGLPEIRPAMFNKRKLTPEQLAVGRLDDKVAVRINHRTVIFCKPGHEAEAIQHWNYMYHNDPTSWKKILTKRIAIEPISTESDQNQ